ncbi:MarR family transcriptional regulator [Streptomyces sp. NPDC059928]|uniref:MarR family transcriptional regulator n=1 Tax=unclassified Streptomyces TaxID=2593676 RepID=UPI0036502C7D
MTTTPTLNGQVIGQAHYATRALLERALSRTDTTFNQSVVLNAVAGGVGSVDTLVSRMTGALKIDEAAARATVAELTEKQLVEALPGDAVQVGLTEAGRTLQQQIQTAVREITERLYGGIPAADLESAGRALTLITERANTELAN